MHLQLHQHELLVTVMAYAMIKDKFNTKPPRDWGDEGHHLTDEVLQVVEALWTHKVKLGATLSRMKVHAGALNIAQLLPESTRERFCEVTTEPIYVRVNADIDVTSRICAAGFKLIGRSEQLVSCHNSAQLLRDDLLAFSSDCRTILWGNELVENGLIIPQVCLHSQCYCRVYQSMHYFRIH